MAFNVQTLLPPPLLSDRDKQLDTIEKNANRYNPNSTDPAVDVFPLQINGGLGGLNPPVVTDGQNVLYPLDSTLSLTRLENLVTSTPGAPSGFALSPAQLDAGVFEGFHSAYQVKYVQNNAGSGSKPGATPPLLFAAVGGGVDANGNKVAGPDHALVSADLSKVYIIERLTKTDITKMPAADVALLQQIVAAKSGSTDLTNFANAITTQLTTLGLSIDASTTTPSADKQAALASIQKFFTASSTSPLTLNGVLATLPSPPAPAGVSTTNMSRADKAVFATEAQALANSILNNPIISAKDVSDQFKLITDRLTQVATFAGQRFYISQADPNNNHSYDAGWIGDTVVSIPDPLAADKNVSPAPLVLANAATNTAYVNMMRQESQIANLAVVAYQQSTGKDLQGNPVSRPRNLDAPALIFQFQLNANLTQEAEIAFSTELVKQVNALLTVYNNMQQMVNATLQLFTASDNAQNDAKATNYLHNSTTGGLVTVNAPLPSVGGSGPNNALDALAIMFDSNEAHNKNPLETLFGITRPAVDLVSDHTNANDPKNPDPTPTGGSYKGKQKTFWTSFNDQLSGVVTQLNQQSQILTDSINSLTKQKDRHFDLGNNALSKMADMIQTIGRGIA